MLSSVSGRLAALALALLPCSPALAQGAQAGRADPEFALKAAFLYNFALYTTWPALNKASFDICILGQDPFGPALDVVARKELKGKAVRLRRLSGPQDIDGCQVLFVAESAHASLPEVVAKHAAQPILTIAEDNGFDPSLPMIRLVPEGHRFGFEINLGAARAAGLDMSSSLLRLARKVE